MKQKREVRLNELHDQFLCQAFFVTNFHSQINVVVLVVCRCFVEWVEEEAHCFSHFFRYENNYEYRLGLHLPNAFFSFASYALHYSSLCCCFFFFFFFIGK
jgi:hypothetical protein